jgi:hypothetical protein
VSEIDTEVCAGCEHGIDLHYNDVRGVVRCLNVDSGTSSKGIIGLPYSVRCDCKDYQSKTLTEKREARHDGRDYTCARLTTRKVNKMTTPLSEEEMSSVERYAKDHESGYGNDSRQARIALRLISEVRERRARDGEAERYKGALTKRMSRPRIICLCGSTKFIETFAIRTWELERQGFIVLGCTLLPMWYCKVPSHFGEATGTKEQCDELHLRKIDLADEVLVLNVNGYIGESTRNEIAYATARGTPVRYLAALTPVETKEKCDATETSER